MKTKIALALAAAAVVLIAMPVLQAQQMKMLSAPERVAALEKSIAAGNKLYSDPKLGTNGATCASCHPGGGTTGGKVTVMGMQVPIPTLMGTAATFPKWKMGPQKVITLGQMNNGCIEMFMKGKPLMLDDQRYADLSAYVTSLSKGKPTYPQLGK